MTGESERLVEVARALERRCPPELASEIAVTGSVGAGFADEHSDIELLLLGETVPDQADVRQWLAEVGATDIAAGAEPSGVWAWARVDGVEIDPWWGTLAEAETEVAAITSGEIVDHRRLAFAHVLLHSVTLRSAGALSALARRCESYPKGLSMRLTDDALTGWRLPTSRIGSAVRGDALAATGFFRAEAMRVLRIVFALNERWEPPRWKWLRAFAHDLDPAPDRLVDRIEEAVRAVDLIHSYRVNAELARDVLDLVPASIDITDARREIEVRLASVKPRTASAHV
jgi:hypothetical protein